MNKMMNIVKIIIIGAILLSSSCAGLKKNIGESEKTAAELNAVKVESKPISQPDPSIKEVEEKLVPNNEKLPDSHLYFVIIGSFRNPDNAKKYQLQLQAEKFSSDILKNESGLYRVSVLATDEIDVAREDIRRIRKVFPQYKDTWLLIQKK